jgi:hypothetical protein
MSSSNSWFNIDPGSLNLTSIASKVSTYVKESPLGEMANTALQGAYDDPGAYKKKHDDYDNGGGMEEIEGMVFLLYCSDNRMRCTSHTGF